MQQHKGNEPRYLQADQEKTEREQAAQCPGKQHSVTLPCQISGGSCHQECQRIQQPVIHLLCHNFGYKANLIYIHICSLTAQKF